MIRFFIRRPIQALMCVMLGGMSTKTAYRLLRSGSIKSLLVGRRYRIPKIYILEYLNIIQKSTS